MSYFLPFLAPSKGFKNTPAIPFPIPPTIDTIPYPNPSTICLGLLAFILSLSFIYSSSYIFL